MFIAQRSTSKVPPYRHSAFTVVEILIVMGIIGALSAITFGVVQPARERAKMATCDARLKNLALSLDAFRQERGTFPPDLNALKPEYVRDDTMLTCPADPRPAGSTPAASYASFYQPRSPRDDPSRPLLVCPYHESLGRGFQARVGRMTTQFTVRPAHISSVNSRADVIHPHSTTPVPAVPLMELHGADVISTPDGNQTVVQFADGSTASLRGGSNIALFQSFMDGKSSGTLYTILRQYSGTVDYHVTTGSKFDVVTPTATAGARGTAFTITVNPDGTNTLLVTEGKVAVSTVKKSGLAPLNQVLDLSGQLLDLLPLEPLGGLLGGLFG